WSPPAENALSPAPVRTTTPTARSAHAARKARISSSTVSARKAFRTSGRLMVIQATPSRVSERMSSYAIDIPSVSGGPLSTWAGARKGVEADARDRAARAPGGPRRRVVADVRVAATDETILLDVDVRFRDAFVEALERLVVADEVEFVPPEAPLALVGLEGPHAERLVGEQLAPYAHRQIEVADVPVRVVRASEVGGPGMVLHVAAERAPALWDALVARGAEPCGMEPLEGRRVEVGVPRVGLDMDPTTLALEVPVESALSATKGCYLGQEVVARG